MSPIKPKYRNLLIVIVVPTILAFAGYVLFRGGDWRAGMWKITTAATTISVPLWLIYERWLWRIPFFRAWGWLCDIPDVSGRWVGTLDRHDARGPHRFVLEIYQTLVDVQCATWTAGADSISTTAEVVADRHRQNVKLVYTWDAQVSKDLDGLPLQESLRFNGTTILSLQGSDPQCLQGRYYTNRVPAATRGDITVWFQSRDRINRFE